MGFTVVTLDSLKGKRGVYTGPTFREGDVVSIAPNASFCTKPTKRDDVVKVQIYVSVNGRNRWVSLNAFTALPEDVEGPLGMTAFQKDHPENDAITNAGDAAEIVSYLLGKTYKVSKVKGKKRNLIQGSDGSWHSEQNEDGTMKYYEKDFSVFERV